MRRQIPIAHQLHAYLFPRPTSNDPPCFSAHLARNLVPEVRIEVATFYGDLNSAEARYPGLNYCYPPHRMRLGRFKHHRRLFDAFDALGLTYNEIQEFCCWEGTKWARERYEKDEGVKVVDTTGDEIPPFVDRRECAAADEGRRKSITRQTEIFVIVEEAGNEAGSGHQQQRQAGVEADTQMEETGLGEDDQSEQSQHVETAEEAAARHEHISELERRRDRAIDQRILAAWEQGQSLPPDIEQYLKEQSERGTLSAALDIRSIINQRAARRGAATPASGSTAVAAVTSRAAA